MCGGSVGTELLKIVDREKALCTVSVTQRMILSEAGLPVRIDRLTEVS